MSVQSRKSVLAAMVMGQIVCLALGSTLFAQDKPAGAPFEQEYIPAAAGAALPDQTSGYRRFATGNSFFNPIRGTITELAHAAGFPKDEHAAGAGAAGVMVQSTWLRFERQVRLDAKQQAPFDLFVAQPFGHVHMKPLSYYAEADAIANMYRVLLERSPNCALMIYYTWMGVARTQDNAEWAAAMRRAIDEYWDPLTDLLEHEFPGKPIYVVPTGPALLLLNDEIKAGKFPKIKSIEEFFYDGGHLNGPGYYLSALVHVASYYRRSPEGLPHEVGISEGFAKEEHRGSPRFATKNTEGPGTPLTKEQAAVLQRVAWQAVQTFPRTTVSGKPRPPKADTQSPSAPANLKATATGERDVMLGWEASQDNVGVALYAVYRNGRLVGTTEKTTLGLSNLSPGTKYNLMVRAFDAAGNCSEASTEVATPCKDGGTTLAGWDLTGYPIGAKEGPYRKPEDCFPASERAPGVAADSSLCCGPGLVPNNQWFALSANGSATSLAQAIDKKEYVTLSLKPEIGKRVALSRMLLRAGAERPMSLAVMTSTAGFAAGKEIATLALGGDKFDFDVSLKDVATLQDVSGPVELRLYVWGDNKPTPVQIGGRIKGRHLGGKGEPVLLLTGGVK